MSASKPLIDVLRLGGAAAVGLLEDDLLVVVLFLPLRLEGGDDLSVDLARRAVCRQGEDGVSGVWHSAPASEFRWSPAAAPQAAATKVAHRRCPQIASLPLLSL